MWFADCIQPIEYVKSFPSAQVQLVVHDASLLFLVSNQALGITCLQKIDGSSAQLALTSPNGPIILYGNFHLHIS